MAQKKRLLRFIMVNQGGFWANQPDLLLLMHVFIQTNVEPMYVLTLNLART